MMRRRLILGVLVAAVAAGCGGGQSPGPALALPSSPVDFAELAAIPLLDADAPAYTGPAAPQDLGDVEIVSEVQRALDEADASEMLVEQGFVVVPSDLRLFHFAYEGNVYEGWPLFVTTDAAYNTWHLVFDKLLRSLEQDVLLGKLEKLVSGLTTAARAQTAELAGTPVEAAASRVEQLFQLAAAELGVPVDLGPLAQQEKALVEAHDGVHESPILGGQIDYSLFTPRGHYTRNDELERYFVAMSVLGQSAFCLPGTRDCPGLEPSRLAILASRVLARDPSLVELWRAIYEPSAFLVGLADDYTPLEMAEAVEKAVPAGLEEPAVFADDAVVRDALDELIAARPVLISPDRAAVRVMGTRFVVDAYVLDQLLWPYVGTEDDKRLVPSGLDVAAAFGSDFAYGTLDEMGETAFEGYDGQLEAMRDAITSRPEEDWGSTVYDAWLHALEPVFVEHGTAFPGFMRSDSWAAKAHQAGLGSYAELKHDTILYAKQAVAEGGDAGVPPRRNWVEPEPVTFGRLAAVAELTREGLDERGLLTKEQAGMLRDAAGLFRFLERIARDELAGKSISTKDNERLTFLGGELERFFWLTSDHSEAGSEADLDAAIIADISSSTAGVLEVGTGRVDRIYVLVPDDAGRFQVAVGGVYSYYEFTTDPGMRLTDEEWRAKLESGDAPERPAWEEAFLAG